MKTRSTYYLGNEKDSHYLGDLPVSEEYSWHEDGKAGVTYLVPRGVCKHCGKRRVNFVLEYSVTHHIFGKTIRLDSTYFYSYCAACEASFGRETTDGFPDHEYVDEILSKSSAFRW